MNSRLAANCTFLVFAAAAAAAIAAAAVALETFFLLLVRRIGFAVRVQLVPRSLTLFILFNEFLF